MKGNQCIGTQYRGNNKKIIIKEKLYEGILKVNGSGKELIRFGFRLKRKMFW